MNPERGCRLERLYHAALERRGEERGRFLAEAREDDAELRIDLESLLAQDLASHTPLDRPAWKGATSLLEGSERVCASSKASTRPKPNMTGKPSTN